MKSKDFGPRVKRKVANFLVFGAKIGFPVTAVEGVFGDGRRTSVVASRRGDDGREFGISRNTVNLRPPGPEFKERDKKE